MIVSFVVAAAENGVIGRDNGLPWRLPADLKHFKAVTLGKPVLMGRKTWDSIGKPLPGRHNIVVSRQPQLSIDGVTVVKSVAEALDFTRTESEVMVIGGAEIFRTLLPVAQRIYLTRVHAQVPGDVYLPAIGDDWIERSRERHAADERNEHPYSFILLERSHDLGSRMVPKNLSNSSLWPSTVNPQRSTARSASPRFLGRMTKKVG